jgi:N-acetylmuramoyl-L-alanine amidase
VGLQVGHWQVRELPDELAKIRGDSGAYYRGYDEWEVNIEIARSLQRRLEAAGVVVDLLPATIPVAYQADAFVSLHCDGVGGELAARRRGWKAATPFRASPAAEALLEAMEESYGRVTGLPPDTRGASFDMRAYYAFASYRYQHAIAPTTPAIIVEAGFMTHPEDRTLLFDDPDRVAQGIAEGLLAFLAQRDLADTTPPELPSLRVGDGVSLFERPSQSAEIVRALDRGEALVTLSRADGWFLVTTREGWDIGWVRAGDVQT